MRKAATIALSLAALTLAACSQSQNPSSGDDCDKEWTLTENTHGDELSCRPFAPDGDLRWVQTGD